MEGASVLETFDKMARLHEHQRREQEFLKQKKERYAREIAASRAARATQTQQLAKLVEFAERAEANVAKLREEEQSLAARLAAGPPRDAELAQLEAAESRTAQELADLERTRPDTRLATELEELQSAHAAEKQQLEEEIASLQAAQSAQSAAAAEERERLEARSLDFRRAVEDEQQMKEQLTKETAAVLEATRAQAQEFAGKFEAAMKYSNSAARYGERPQDVPSEDTALIERYKRSLLLLERELQTLKRTGAARKASAGGRGSRVAAHSQAEAQHPRRQHEQRQPQHRAKHQNHQPHQPQQLQPQVDLTKFATTINSGGVLKRKPPAKPAAGGKKSLRMRFR